MTWEDARKNSFRYFPVLDILAVLIVGVATSFGSIYDETMTYGFPALLIVIGALLWFAALRQGEKKRFLYGVRITVISLLALIVAVILQQTVS